MTFQKVLTHTFLTSGPSCQDSAGANTDQHDGPSSSSSGSSSDSDVEIDGADIPVAEHPRAASVGEEVTPTATPAVTSAPAPADAPSVPKPESPEGRGVGLPESS